MYIDSPLSRVESSDHKYPIRWFGIRGASGLISYWRHIHHPFLLFFFFPVSCCSHGNMTLWFITRTVASFVCSQHNDEKIRITMTLHTHEKCICLRVFRRLCLALTWSTFWRWMACFVMVHSGKMQTLVSRLCVDQFCSAISDYNLCSITFTIYQYQNQYNCHLEWREYLMQTPTNTGNSTLGHVNQQMKTRNETALQTNEQYKVNRVACTRICFSLPMMTMVMVILLMPLQNGAQMQTEFKISIWDRTLLLLVLQSPQENQKPGPC